MKSKKLYLLIGILVILTLLAGACSSKPAPKTTSAPAPAPTTSAPKPTTSAAPTTTAAPTASPTKHPQVELTMFSGPTGTSNWALGQGLGQLLAKSHPWLRLVVVENAAGIQPQKKQQENPTTSIAFATSGGQVMIQRGVTPFTAPYMTSKLLMRIDIGAVTWVTLNPNIKTIYDFVGKKIDLCNAGSTSLAQWTDPLMRAEGLMDKITPVYSGFAPGATALLDGLIDANLTYIGYGGGSPWTKGTYMEQLTASKKVYPISIPNESFDKVNNLYGAKVAVPIVEQKDALAPGLPAADVTAFASPFFWTADEKLDPEISYELVKFVYEHVKDFVPFHSTALSWTGNNIAQIPGFTEKDYHPGAVKFLKEKGIKIGS